MRYLDEDDTLVTIYRPNENRGGIFFTIRQTYADLMSSRHVIARLFLRDFVTQFRQKILGYVWAILGPLFGISSFLFLFFAGILKPGDGEIPYVAYVLVGGSIWNCLPGAMGAVSTGFQNQSDLILRTRIPKLALAISSLANFFYSLLISMVTMALVLLLVGVKPTWWYLAYPVLVLPMILLGTAFGLILAVLGTIAKDLTQLATQILSLMMYVTPVVYLYSTIQNPLLRTIVSWNPVTYLIDVPRSLICLGSTDQFNLYALSALICLIFVVVGLRAFYLLEDLVAERL